MKVIVVIFICLVVVVSASFSIAANKLIDYGFEDWTGDADTTPGYIFSTDSNTYWSYHETGSRVLSNCNGKTAYSGKYFWRNQLNEAYDACLGTTVLSQNSHDNVGLAAGGGATGGPRGGGDKTYFADKIKTGTFFVRLRIRFIDWQNESLWPGCKLLRMTGTSQNSDAFLHVQPNGGVGANYYIYDWNSGYGDGWWHSSLFDENWHSVCFMIKIISSTKLDVSVWWDNWDASGIANANRTINVPSFGSGFWILDIAENLSGATPKDSLIVDVDDLQVWDGKPPAGVSMPSRPDPPGNLIVQGIN
jgi:hypothetical protein